MKYQIIFRSLYIILVLCAHVCMNRHIELRNLTLHIFFKILIINSAFPVKKDHSLLGR